mmetsp:Transcript_30098/g.62330  ORF Transcript_30098/g.62330 Transcript_30098/m.62330 type:complete len:743 (+) Transcript_30098:2-2230(+)
MPKTTTAISFNVNESHAENNNAVEHQYSEHQHTEQYDGEQVAHHDQNYHQDVSWVCNQCLIYNHSTSESCSNCHLKREQVEQAPQPVQPPEVEVPPSEGNEGQPTPEQVGGNSNDEGAQIPANPTDNSLAQWAPATLHHHELEAQPTWVCPKCQKENLQSKARCGSCQAWKNGERKNITRKTATVQVDPPQPWACHGCGQTNGAKKVRCNSCQKWKNGKRKIAEYGTHIPMSMVPTPSSEEQPWTCDKCGNVNGGSKVRCCSCPRWKNGKRPNLRRVYQLPPGPHGFPALPGGVPGQPAPTQNWTCHACGNVNLPSKVRCSSCQKWKGGKRENKWKVAPPGMQLQHNAALASYPPSTQGELEWVCDGCDHRNNWAKARCGSCQRWKGGKRTKTGSNSQGIVIASAVGNQPNTPWNCAKCGNSNTAKKLRCSSCQSWKNGRRQIKEQNDAGHMNFIPMTGQHQANIPHSKDGTRSDQQDAQTINRQEALIPQLPWACHKCGKSNAATKSRCGACQAWKGGVRTNIGSKKSSETWPCDKCGRINAGNKVRCGQCQRWKGGGRPDVLARKEAKAMNPRNLWPCDSCGKPNKASKVRCGNCQRWRGGMRPNIRKRNPMVDLAMMPFKVPPAPKHPPHQPVPPLSPGIHQATLTTANQEMDAPHQAAVLIEAAPTATNISQTVNISQPTTQGNPSLELEERLVHTSNVNEEKPNDGSWICDKCTCDNLASETKCKICDAAKSDKAVV